MFPGFKAKYGTWGTFISDIYAYQPKYCWLVRMKEILFVVSVLSWSFEGT